MFAIQLVKSTTRSYTTLLTKYFSELRLQRWRSLVLSSTRGQASPTQEEYNRVKASTSSRSSYTTLLTTPLVTENQLNGKRILWLKSHTSCKPSRGAFLDSVQFGVLRCCLYSYQQWNVYILRPDNSLLHRPTLLEKDVVEVTVAARARPAIVKKLVRCMKITMKRRTASMSSSYH